MTSEQQETRKKLAYREGIVSIFVNIILFVLKLWAGLISGSIALIADAWHTLSDSLSSIIVIASVKLSSRKANDKYPFGHGRWEQISSIFIGFLLSIVAYDFMKESIIKLGKQESANFGVVAIVVTVLSVLMKEGLAQYAFKIAKKTDNTAVKADGWHHRTDALSSIVVLVGIFLKDYFWWIDSVLGIIIALMLFYAVYGIVKESISRLLGETPSDEMKNRIIEIVKESHPVNLHPHHFLMHDYGVHQEITFHIKLDNEMTVIEAHDIVDKVEKQVNEQMNINTTIHVDPITDTC
ncbi:MAG: cation diffusion facilitator family transporter [Bacteroidales bacterium]|jgi:cation diffusion facilitator family transporter|nr:cation diffusion facilitator family transporter [Bacteroidales bacterium]